VAEYKAPLLNGNPETEPGLSAAAPGCSLLSALAIPVENETGILGVLTLYSKQKDAFDARHLRLFMGLRPKLADALESALEAAAERATAGRYPLCDLPNAGALLEHLDEVLAHGRVSKSLVVFAVRLSGGAGAPEPFLACLEAFVREFGAGGSFLARVGDDDFVAVLEQCGYDPLVLEAALSGKLKRSGDPRISVGCAQAPFDATEAEDLIAIAAHRLHPCDAAGGDGSAPKLLDLSRVIAGRLSEQQVGGEMRFGQ